MGTIVYEKEFVFNEMEYFTNLLKGEDMTRKEKEELLLSMNLEESDYKFVYQKDSKGSWFKHCYKGNDRINWDDFPPALRSIVWDFEKENKMFF